MAMFLFWVAGCAEPEHGDVQGKVTIGGKPADNLKVVFIPEHTQGTKAPYTYSFTDAEGRFRLKTVKGREGAILGHYRVLMHDIAAGRPGGPATSRVSPPYENANQTPLKNVEVKPGTQTLDFDLK